MKNKKKEIKTLSKLSKKDLADLLFSFMVGNSVREAVAVYNGKDYKRFEKQLDFVLEKAEEMGFDDLVQDFNNSKLPSSDLCKKEELIIAEYNDIEFWENLEIRLGKRDFFESLSSEEMKDLRKNFWLPEKVHKYYEKYQKEFEKYGIERLRVKNEF
ncbi:hypothetical protein K0B04_01030 [Patescibacteria group bacterium]|nr:hypothetical protein [Patescibacteria group bacterium]